MAEDDVSELARKLAAQRRIVQGACEVCGKSFSGTRKRKFCSHTCAQRDYYARSKQKERDNEQ